MGGEGWGGELAGGGSAAPQTNKQDPPGLLPSTLTGPNAAKSPSTLPCVTGGGESLALLHRRDHGDGGEKKRSLCGTFTCFPRASRAVSDGCECGRGARTMGQFIAVRQQGCQEGNLWAAAASESSGARNVNGFWAEEASCPAAATRRAGRRGVREGGAGENKQTNRKTQKECAEITDFRSFRLFRIIINNHKRVYLLL